MINMNWHEFLSYVNKGESQTQKFLGDVSSAEVIGHLLVAMANTNGGHIFIGFDIKNYHFKGTDINPEFIQDVIDTYISPGLDVDIQLFKRDEKNVMIIKLPESNQRPYYFNKMCFTMNEQNKPHLALLENDDMKAFKTYRETKNEASVSKTQEDLDIEEITSELINLTQSDDAGEEANMNTSLPIPRSEPKQQFHYSRPFNQPKQINSTFNTGFSLDSNEPQQEAQDELNSVADCSLNKDVSFSENNQDSGTFLSSEEEIDLSNEVSDLLSNSVTHDSEQVLELSLPKPQDDFLDSNSEHSEKTESVEKTIFYKQTGFSVDNQVDPKDLNDRQQRALAFLTREKSIKNKLYRQLFSVSHKTAHLELVDLVAKGYIQSQGSGRSTCYVLTTNLVDLKQS